MKWRYHGALHYHKEKVIESSAMDKCNNIQTFPDTHTEKYSYPSRSLNIQPTLLNMWTQLDKWFQRKAHERQKDMFLVET